MSDDYQQERSRLANKHAQEVKELEKEMKKKKGAMKDEVQQRLDEAVERHRAELAAFDKKHGKSTKATEKEKEKDKDKEKEKKEKKEKKKDKEKKKKKDKDSDSESEKEPSSSAAAATASIVGGPKNWNALSKTELEEECGMRGLSKKGKKEELVMRLILYQQEAEKQKTNSDQPSAEDLEAKKKKEIDAYLASAVAVGTVQPKKKKYGDKRGRGRGRGRGAGGPGRGEVVDSEEEEKAIKKRNKAAGLGGDSDEDESDEDDDDDRIETEDPEEAEKQRKREALIAKGMAHLWKKFPRGVDVSELTECLEKVGLRGFNPAALGYRSVEAYLRNQPPAVLFYDRKGGRVCPPRDDEDEDEDDEEDEDKDERPPPPSGSSATKPLPRIQHVTASGAASSKGADANGRPPADAAAAAVEEERGDVEMGDAEGAAVLELKRLQVVRNALKLGLKSLRNPEEGIEVDRIPEFLDTMGLKNFSPEVVGFEDMAAFVDAQPGWVLQKKGGGRVGLPVSGGGAEESDSSDEEEE